MSSITAPNELIAADGGLQPDPFPLVNWRTDVRHEPKQERSIATRKLILDAARSLANENGISGVTMQLVSQRAGIANGTAYQFFDDLECIYRDIYEEWYRDWWSVILMYTSEIWTEQWERQLKALITGSCNFLLKHADSWPAIRHVDATARSSACTGEEEAIDWRFVAANSIERAPLRKLVEALVHVHRVAAGSAPVTL